MTKNADDSAGRDLRVNEAIAAYLQAVDAGWPPDREAFVARYPDLAGELQAFLTDRECFQRLARPLGNDAPTVAASPLPVDQSLGTVPYFGDYELLEEIARGGMGVVYKARQVSLDRIVALKMILAGQLASPADVQRFHAEAKAAANLKHPNIVAIHEVGQHEGQHFFSMDYVAGRSLAELVRANPLPAARAARYVQTVAEAIEHAHQQGTLHRDLKPSNVLIDEADRPHVTDFGLAKQIKAESGLTVTGQILGTPSYMPPEQAAGRTAEVGPASDVYSLGALLYDLLTGRPPFRAESVFDTIVQVVNTEPVPPRLLNPSVPRALDTICLKCLEKDPAKRFASAQELADDLGRFLAGEPIRARPPSIPFAVRHWVRQNVRAMAWTVGIGLVSGLLMSGVVGLYHWGNLARDVREGYAFFPSVAQPAVSWPLDWSPPGWLVVATVPLLLIVMLAQGLIAQLIVRPANRAGDVVVGAAVGLVAGLTFFTLALGPLFSQEYGIEPSEADLDVLARAASAAAPAPQAAADPLGAAYPDLARLDPGPPRAAALRSKIIADLRANSSRAVWIAMMLSLLPVPAGAAVAMLAGRIVRRGDRAAPSSVGAYDPSYLVFAVGICLLITLLYRLLVAFGFWSMETPWWFVLQSLPGMAAWNVRLRHRKVYHEPIWRRHQLLAVFLLLSGLISLSRFLAGMLAFLDVGMRGRLGQVELWPWYIDVGIHAVTVLLTVRYLARPRAPTPP